MTKVAAPHHTLARIPATIIRAKTKQNRKNYRKVSERVKIWGLVEDKASDLFEIVRKDGRSEVIERLWWHFEKHRSIDLSDDDQPLKWHLGEALRKDEEGQDAANSFKYPYHL